jgi:hypothetical protein
VTEGWRKFHDEEFHNIHSSPVIISVIISTKMKYVGYVTRMTEMRNVFTILAGEIEGRDYLEDLCIDGKIIDR